MLHGPPRQSLSAVAFSFVGIFVTMLTVIKVHNVLDRDDGNPTINPG